MAFLLRLEVGFCCSEPLSHKHKCLAMVLEPIKIGTTYRIFVGSRFWVSYTPAIKQPERKNLLFGELEHYPTTLKLYPRTSQFLTMNVSCEAVMLLKPGSAPKS